MRPDRAPESMQSGRANIGLRKVLTVDRGRSIEPRRTPVIAVWYKRTRHAYIALQDPLSPVSLRPAPIKLDCVLGDTDLQFAPPAHGFKRSMRWLLSPKFVEVAGLVEIYIICQPLRTPPATARVALWFVWSTCLVHLIPRDFCQL